ncbi:hypothetical protein Poly30_51110 [Planctomycetes bacterium Poly30]|uniref:Uncharacterized protein n=1 Tax=Saltatorellus ferox TaxID=2528018 RepID=A0A518EZN9_9BACT|nr:hypothetical protein Poly30_51110 [Planctomycetes bacterium Poly30]
MPAPLEPGLYEQLIDAWLEERLSTASESRAEIQETRLDTAMAADRLAMHFGRLLERAILDLPEKQRRRRGVELTRALVEEARYAWKAPRENAVDPAWTAQLGESTSVSGAQKIRPSDTETSGGDVDTPSRSAHRTRTSGARETESFKRIFAARPGP